MWLDLYIAGTLSRKPLYFDTLYKKHCIEKSLGRNFISNKYKQKEIKANLPTMPLYSRCYSTSFSQYHVFIYSARVTVTKYG